MREIKFRFWDKKYKHMHCDEPAIYLNGCGDTFEDTTDTHNTPHTEIEFNDNLIPLQYTGLTDKNEKEIYEGDICIIKDNILENKEEIEIEFSSGSFGYWDIEEHQPLFLEMDLEIIGNIYENHELLEDK